MSFKFELGDDVRIDMSGEVGRVIGRAEYSATTSQYFILFKSAGGRAVTGWWEADFISKING